MKKPLLGQMFVNIYAGELPTRKTCNFDKHLNHILKVMDGTYFAM